MIDPATDAMFRAFAAERRYGAAALDRWAQLDGGDAAALLELVQELRLGEHQLRDLWDWIDEIAARDRVSRAHVLGSESVVTARRSEVGRNDKLRLIKGALRRLRFPQLAATEDRLLALIRELGLPRDVRITLPEFLEGDSVRVEISADSAAALRTAAAALQAAANGPLCEQIFALLTEA